MHQGKFKKSPKKLSRVRFYKVLVLDPLFLTVSDNYAKLKTSKYDLGTKSIKKVKINHESNFCRGFGGWNFPNKIQKYGNFEIELERVRQQ